MDDLEITRLCARAIEVWKTAHEQYPTMTLDSTFSGVEVRGDRVYLVPSNPFRQDPQIYDPLHNRAQAIELVERLGMRLHMETQCNGDDLRQLAADIRAAAKGAK